MALSYKEEIDSVTPSSTIMENYTLNLIVSLRKGNHYEYD